jgi:parallel beta-helix repeat protein
MKKEVNEKMKKSKIDNKLWILIIVTMICLSSLAFLPSASAVPQFIDQFSANNVEGIVLDDLGNIYAAVNDPALVAKYDPNHVFQTSFSAGGGNAWLGGIARDSLGNIYVSDYNVDPTSVRKYTSSGSPLWSIGSFEAVGVALDSTGKVYVSDTTNNLINIYDSIDGSFISSFGSGILDFPQGIAFDSLGNIYVADSGNNRVVKFNSIGIFQTTIGGPGSGPGEFSNGPNPSNYGPDGLDLDDFDNLYAADTGNNRIQVFNPSGTFLFTFGSSGTGNGGFNIVDGVTVDISGTIYASDTGNNLVQIFKNPCPLVVWVDDDYTSSSCGGHMWGFDAFDCLQIGIDTVCDINGTVNVYDGTYGVTGLTNKDGYTTAILIKGKDNLTIQAISGNEPVVKPLTSVETDIISISIEDCNNIIIDNIDSDQTIAQFDNWHVFDTDDITLKNSQFEGGEDGIDFNTALTTAQIENNIFKNITTGSGDEVLDFTDGICNDVVIQDNFFDNNYRHITLDNGDSEFIIRRNIMDGTTSEEAIRLIDASDVTIENNIIMKNQQQGVYVDSGCSDISIQHNAFYNNDQENTGNGEIRTKVVTSDILIKNNIIYGTGTNPAFETTVTSLPSEDYNCVYNTNDIGVFTFGLDTLVDVDPEFMCIDVGAEDFHLQDNSLCIDSGTNLGVIDDILGNMRDENPDRGAYEYFENLDLDQSVFDRGFPIRHAVDGDWGAAQNFTPTKNVLTSMQIYLRTFGTPEFDLVVELRENGPDGVLIDTVVFSPTETPTSWAWFDINFNDTYVISGTDYFIVCPPAPSGVATSFGYEWAYAFGDQYMPGSFWFTRDGGSLWRDLPTMYEFTFRTYGYT